MSKQSQAWKNLERQAAEALGGTRVLRGANFAESDSDVKIQDFPHLVIDCKYRTRHAHHTLLAEVVTKYCDAKDVPVLVTKHHNQTGANVTLPLGYLAELLAEIRHLRSEVMTYALSNQDLYAKAFPGAGGD